MPIVKDPEARKLLDEMKEDTQWYKKNYQKLAELHNEEFVAISRQSIVAHNKDFETLMQEVKKNFKEETPLIEYVSKEGVELVL